MTYEEARQITRDLCVIRIRLSYESKNETERKRQIVDEKHFKELELLEEEALDVLHKSDEEKGRRRAAPLLAYTRAKKAGKLPLQKSRLNRRPEKKASSKPKAENVYVQAYDFDKRLGKVEAEIFALKSLLQMDDRGAMWNIIDPVAEHEQRCHAPNRFEIYIPRPDVVRQANV